MLTPFAGTAGVEGSVPVPRAGWVRCGACGSTDVHPKEWVYHQRPGQPTVPHRCNVELKCYDCAACWVHGVAISFAWWGVRPRAVGHRWTTIRGARWEDPLHSGGAGVVR